jgi:uncharacterized membrane-anchored protein
MRRARLIVFVAIIAAQVAVVGTMAAGREAVLRTGDKVVLQTAPVDPRDLFRGDYVVLDYAISTIDTNQVAWDAADPFAGQTVWVVLEPTERYHEPVVVTDRPVDHELTAIRGVVEYSASPFIRLRYGIEEYFVPEGTGREIERSQDVDVVVAVADDDSAVIDHLIVDGRTWRSGDD